MALLGIIRRWYIRDRVSIREIARRLDISRNTVRRYIRSEAIEPSYASRHSPSSLDAYAPRLSAWLSSELVKSRKQRRTLKQMFLELRELGYEGSYDRVAAFSRHWKAGQLERVKSASKSTASDLLFDDEGYWDTSQAWRGHQPVTNFVDLIAQVLPSANSWNDEVCIWGTAGENNIQVSYKDELVESVAIRIDTRGDALPMCLKVIHLAKAMNCLLFLPASRSIIMQDAALLIGALLNSKASHPNTVSEN
ncbi:winged helix-turn-helix transcriptional regulator [Herbaspirillum huttiense]|uniref:winged helix-turn-helix transcriptional regulator n=2 Tax=Herbaspirillum huttiense TaxID=863372 RepID=UPI0014171007